VSLAVEPPPEPAPPVLADWLGPTPVDVFRTTALGRVPCASPGTTRGVGDIVDWAAVDRGLAASPAPDVLVVARGHLLPLPAPRSLREARRLLDVGIGFVIRCAERQDAAIAAVTAAIGRDAGGDARAQLFVTPARSHGFGWHYDHEEVERSPVCTARLVAGDFLYLPGGWWPMAECREESLSVSIGVRPAHTRSR
jgi:50S ribosomal protein L16 3-hydroxylase